MPEFRVPLVVSIEAASEAEAKRIVAERARLGWPPVTSVTLGNAIQRRTAESPVYFFGCAKGTYGETAAGHYLYVEGPQHDKFPRRIGIPQYERHPIPLGELRIDGGFCPHYGNRRSYAKAKLTHWKGWTALGFWDSSGDTRPGSDSNFFMEGTLRFEDAMAEAMRAFPEIIERAETKYGPVELVQTVRA